MIPKYLYHYTSIESLEKILQSRTFKFTRLDLLNDPLEGLLNIDNGLQVREPRKLVYCSSWTSNETESISMWGLYKDFKGVRLKCASNLFALDEKINLKEIQSGFMPFCNIKPIQYQIKGVNGTSSIKQVYGPFKVKYVDEYSKLYTDVVKNEVASANDFISIEISELGNQKMNDWAYEEEWRFKVSAYLQIVSSRNIWKNIKGDLATFSEQVFIPFQKNPVEIMVGPCMKKEDIQKVQAIISNYSEETKIAFSSVRINAK